MLLADSSTQWRVMFNTGVDREPIVWIAGLDSQERADEFMADLRAEYPHADVWVESREVTAWEKDKR